ncbi:aromatic ring-hydroxylating dioxygenase subunit alpha [Oceanicoccus sp. KOV_DT_Chl]|uniref:aromatic ring-hydroxylating oxygenase subunit alpha n=1 Tax=Oceanicoccus sp. KOV_DT_Chl TaxID=1904639 RepID=UPI000C7A8088|nr:aromatic ring-hydroxylating dioxygenase subunit alpha [Oceanicoccus sp. KOV_DT_Chl]
MYINFWYPIVVEKELVEEPVRVEVLGVKLAVFRDDIGRPAVIADTCSHRGGSLGKGVVKNGAIVCPYHGWSYNSAGECVDIPTMAVGDQKIPARAKVDSYPTEVKYGIVFAFLGDLPAEQRPPIAWDAPECDDPEWRACEIKVFDVDYYYERSVENGLDPAHNEFVHPNQGAPTPTRDWVKDPIDIVKEDFASHFTLSFLRQNKGLLGNDAGAEIKDGDSEMIIAGSGHLGPNSVVTWISPQVGQDFRQYFFEAPISDKKTRIFFLTTRSYMIDPDFDEDIMEVNMQIALEDVDVVKEIDPIRTPDSNIKEVLIATDAPILSYREYLKLWKDKGWKIDWKKMQQLKGDVALAIPSPARRNAKGWVLDAVPLIDPNHNRSVNEN